MGCSTTIAQGSDDALLAQRFETFRQTTGTSVVGLMPVTQTLNGDTHFGEGLFVGDETQIHAIRRNVEGRRLPKSWNPCCPDWPEVNQFVLPRTAQVKLMASCSSSSPINSPSEPSDQSVVRDTIRMLVYDGAVCVGWFGCVRDPNAATFTANDLIRVNRRSDNWVAELTARHRREHQLLRESPAHFVIDDRGRVVAQSAGVEAWVTPSRLQRMSTVAEAVRRDGAGVFAIGRYAFRGVELHSDAGSIVYLNAPLGTFGSIALSALTKRQREAASLIALGLKSNEAAEEMNISVHTLKQHLSTIYRLVGVRRREQLVAILHARGIEPM